MTVNTRGGIVSPNSGTMPRWIVNSKEDMKATTKGTGRKWQPFRNFVLSIGGTEVKGNTAFSKGAVAPSGSLSI
jgi:hypothetical protein